MTIPRCMYLCIHLGISYTLHAIRSDGEQGIYE